MKIVPFDPNWVAWGASNGSLLTTYSGGSNSALGDTSGAGDVVGSPGDYTVVGLRRQVSLASNIGGTAIGDVLTIVQTSPRLAMFATPSNSGSVSYGSNAMSVGATNQGGVATDASRSDHRHQGLLSLTSSSSNTLQRPTVNLRAGNNIAFGATDTDGDGNFDTITISATNVAQAGQGTGSGDYVRLGQTVASGSVSQIEIGSLPATYRHLKLIICAKGTDTASQARALALQVGNSSVDTGTNYAWMRNVSGGGFEAGGVTSSFAAGSVSMTPLITTHASVDANAFSTFEILIPDYASTSHWRGFQWSSTAMDADSYEAAFGSGLWKSTSAIDTVRISAGAGNLASGSSLTIYGLF